MATRKRPSRKKPDPAEPPSPAPDKLSDDQEDQRREAIVKTDAERQDDELNRRDEMRMDMMRSVVTEPLLSKVQANPQGKYEVIIALNELFVGGIEKALSYVEERAKQWGVKYATVSHYCFACLTGEQILALAKEARDLAKEHGRRGSVIYRIWEDNDITVSLTHSLTTVKADAAQRAFWALGEDVVWAVLDSGIQGDHPHFKAAQSPFGPIDSLQVGDPLSHTDFTPLQNGALTDGFGHGTHVAGIIGGYWQSPAADGERVVGTEMRNEGTNEPIRQRESLHAISGVAPRCSLLSLKVIADTTVAGDTKQTAGQGKVSWVLLAIDQIQKWNQNGKRLLVHGVNMSLGYDFDPRWFGCGQSPLCVEVNRLVKSGVSVVVSAGNAGYSSFITAAGKAEARYSDLSISDPGNADLAITVGSTHRDMPHLYGVSYFSSRGPTGDGRMKPDLVAPGERIISCAAGLEARKYDDGSGVPALYCEQSGTSMAAPHVSGAIAAFLSVRREFIGQPERVKEVFLANTIDLQRERKFQGAGLLDLMKALQAV
jgi:serine protease AprX